MRASNKSSIITGVVLLLLAALFSISLILLPLDYGIAGPGHNNIIYLLGDMLYSVYGFCSILIPIFLLIAGLSCFASKWTARKTLRLLTALIPFFTCVVTEIIIRSIVKVDHSAFRIVKILIALITGAMLVVIEYLGTGIIADRVNKVAFKKPSFLKKSGKTDEIELSEIDEAAPEAENYSENSAETTSDDTNEDSLPVEGFTKLSKFKAPKLSIFDKLKNKFAKKDEDEDVEDDEADSSSKPSIFDKVLADIDTGVGSSLSVDDDETAVSAEEAEIYEMSKMPLSTATEQAESTAQPESVETAAMSGTTPQSSIETKAAASDDETETPNSIITQEEFAALTTPEDELEWPDLPPQPENLPPEYDADFDENDPALDFPPKEEPAVVSAEEDKNDPYASTRYIDTVVENPKFPHRIVIRDSSEPDASDYAASEEKKTPEQPIEKSKFPTRINLNDNLNTAPDSVTTYFEEEVSEPKIATKENLYNYFEKVDASKTKPVIDDPYKGEAVTAESADNEAAVIEDNPQIFNQLAQQEEINISSAAANVFSEMEADIRKNMPAKEPVANNNAGSHGPHGGATNLTKDELSDFFNAQQEENTPHTKEIAANPPKTHRAAKKGPYVIPSDLLTAYKDDQYWIIDDATKQASLNLKQTLAEFNIEADITGIKKGPVVTMFEILPAPGVKLSKIVALQDNIALSLAAQSVRIVAPIPGKQAVGIEVPNRNRSVVGFREIIEMDLPEWKKMSVPVVLGKDILGKAQLIDLVKTPHMLIAGATGSGKSVCVNSLILSILYKRSFEDVKMILVDPKVVELKLYNNIPHLLVPVITEPKKAIQALQWCLCEMERRYALLDSMGVRDISNYNTKIKEQKICTEKLPYIVVIIDEFADLMATSGKELENIVARLTAMSRAVGIHLVLATQRPSVNVITGLIKANIPTRIAFMVASRTDSNIIIDTVGAEKLLGRGDMLYASAVDPAPIRIQGTFVSDQEVENVVTAVKDYGEPDYIDEEIFVEDDDEEGGRDLFGEPMSDDDPLYDQALEIVVQSGKASASYIQRRLKIGYNRAARLVEEMEERGIVGPANGSKPREVIHVP